MGKIQPTTRSRRRSHRHQHQHQQHDYEHKHKHDRDHECDPDAPICGNEVCCSPPPISDHDKKRNECDLVDEDANTNVNINANVNASENENAIDKKKNDPIKELLIIGAGPHALTLLLRLMEPEPDFLTEKERHRIAESKKLMRPIHDVYRHVKILSRAKPKSKSKIIRQKNKNKQQKKSQKSNPDDDVDNDATTHNKTANTTTTTTNTTINNKRIPPPLTLEDVIDSVHVVDANGKNGWLSHWKTNFTTLGIRQLRSLMNAHADPYDHRSLEYYAEVNKRGDELKTLTDLFQRDKQFTGPYQVPTTALFHDFHDALVRAYGIGDIVQYGKVLSIHPLPQTLNGETFSFDDKDEPIFEVTISSDNGDREGTTIVKTKRVVCAMGPAFSRRREMVRSSVTSTSKSNINSIDEETPWEASLRKDFGTSYPSERIIHADEIVPWLKRREEEMENNDNDINGKCNMKRLLIVGGGITSAQLTLRAVSPSPDLGFENVTFIQRSKSLQRHFDVENCWMGPNRGKLLDDFFSLDMSSRVDKLREARRGGSIPPEILKLLRERERGLRTGGPGRGRAASTMLECKEEVQIENIEWAVGGKQEFVVTLDDGSEGEYDMIWLATGSRNHIDRYPALDMLRETLPINIINGLPVLAPDLSWSSPSSMPSTLSPSLSSSSLSSSKCDNQNESNEPKWKQIARKRIWCMGALSALELGPDALNIIGARHGAVKVASAIRNDIHDEMSM